MYDVYDYTLLVKVDEEGNILRFPAFMRDVKLDNLNISFVLVNDSEFLETLGYYVVQERPVPEGDVVEMINPVLIDGKWTKTFSIRPFNEEELAVNLANAKENAHYEINERLNAALEIGFSFNFGTDEEPLMENVQLRESDLAKIVGCGLKADRLLHANVTDLAMPFRTYENNTRMLMPEQMKDLSDKAYDAYLVFIGLAWQLKDVVISATTIDQLPEIPATLELPNGWERIFSPA